MKMVNRRSISVFLVLFTAALVLTGINVVNAKPKEISVAILMPAPSKKIHKNWKPLADYLGEKMGVPVKIITPRGYDKAKKAMPDTDFVYANSYLFSLLKQDIKLTPIVQMQNTGHSVFSKGRIIVRKDSPIHNVSDFKGKRISLISRYGAGAYLAPRAYLRKQGIDIDKDMDVEYTSNLKKSAYNVILGRSDMAVMCNVNYEILSRKMDTGELRVFDMTDKFPEALIFTRLDTESDMVKRFRQALLDNDQKKDNALQSLHSMKISSFVPYDPAVEENIKMLSKQANIN